MKVLFVYNTFSISSWLIRFFTFSKFSHVAIKISDTVIVDSTLASGVRAITTKEFIKHYPKYVELDVYIPNENLAKDFLLSQIGKPYDLTAIFGMVLQRKWHEEDSWFCSELLEAAIKAGGKPRFRDDVYRITPQQSWAVL